MLSYPITKACYDRLQVELADLKSQRLVLAEKIEEARGHGDLKENAEYHIARDEQSFNEARIALIETRLADARIVDPSELAKDRVYFGSTVHIKNLETQEEKVFQIVSEDEVSVPNGKISSQSPTAKSMLNKSAGDFFIVKAPKGDVEYKVLEIL